jgi:4-amino-4-deoxy-L-arabinose transferase-like glycosyltransferase
VTTLTARLPRIDRAVRMSRAVEAGALALIVMLAAYVYTRDLHTYPNFDEGNYLGSLDALRHGQALGKDVFLDQPPGWYLLLVALSYPFGNSVVGIRTGLVVVTLSAIVGAYVCGRLVGGPVAGLVAAAVIAVAGPLPGFAGLVESEPAAAALAVVAIALAVYAYRDRFRPWAALAAGVALAASTSVKLPGATAALPIATLAVFAGSEALWRRLLLPLLGTAAVFAALVIAYRNVLQQIWQGVVATHTRILGVQTAASNVHRAATFVDPRTPFGCLVIGGALASCVVAARGRQRRLLVALWLWAVSGYGFVLAMHPLSDHHLVFLGVPLGLASAVGLGLLASSSRDRRPAPALILMVLVAAFVAAGLVKDRRDIDRANAPEPPQISWAVSQLRSHTRAGQLVVSDLPIVPYLADRRMPGQLIDTSIARIADEALPPLDVLKLIGESGASAVIIGRMFQTKPVIVAGIRSRYVRRLHYQLHPGYVDIFLDRRP